MNGIKRTLTVLLVFAVTLSCFVLPASAASLVWDGKTPLEAGKKYVVNSQTKLYSPVVVPEGTTLTISDGSELLIYSKADVTVKGKLVVNKGATVTNSGKLTVDKGGVLNNKGTLLSSVNAKLYIKGEFNNYADALFKSSSETLVYKDGKINNTGDWYVLKSCNMLSSGEIVNTVKGDFHIQGKLSVTVSGEMRSSGYVTVGKNGVLKISGKVWFKTGSGYTRFGKTSVTKNGEFTDHSNKVSNAKFTINLLTDKPQVLSKGIDVSYAQGDIDWAKVAASGIDFAIIRAGRGDLGSGCKTDDYFVQNIKGATENGIDVGVYFYSYANTVEEAQKEAQYLVSIIKDYRITYPVILDMEEEMKDAMVTEMIEAFFKVIIKSGYYPMFYSYKSWIEQYLDMRILDKYSVWLAQTGVSAPTYEGGFYIWQYSHTGKVSGIEGDVDLNIAYRDFPKIFRQYRINNLR